MDYKKLSAVVDLMGGTCGYSEEGGQYSISVKINGNKYGIIRSSESLAIKSIEFYLETIYPIQYQNELHQLNFNQ